MNEERTQEEHESALKFVRDENKMPTYPFKVTLLGPIKEDR